VDEPVQIPHAIAHSQLQNSSDRTKDIIYEAFLPLILQRLQQPNNVKCLAESLNVRQSQMQDWLDKAVVEGHVRKTNKPVAYVINQSATQLSFL
jgi:predicted Rossmann fold nucleotide-binding protein DprA/Smf involved in DNA uptake